LSSLALVRLGQRATVQLCLATIITGEVALVSQKLQELGLSTWREE
jgi:hypothetical protein